MSYDKSESIDLDCVGFRARLDAVLDARRSPQLDMPLGAHALRCPKCADWLETQTMLLETVERAGQPDRQTDFSLRVVQEFETGRRDRLRRLRRTVMSVAIAASLLVMINLRRVPSPPDARNEVTDAPEIKAVVLRRVNEVSQDIKPVSGSVYTALNAIWLAQQIL